jgi:hypothetical protein
MSFEEAIAQFKRGVMSLFGAGEAMGMALAFYPSPDPPVGETLGLSREASQTRTAPITSSALPSTTSAGASADSKSCDEVTRARRRARG